MAIRKIIWLKITYNFFFWKKNPSIFSSHITSADHRPLSPSPSVHHQPTTILSTIAHHPSSPILVIMRLAPTPPTITMSPLCHLRRSSMLLEIWFSTFLFFPFHLFNLVHGDHFLPLLYCSESGSEWDFFVQLLWILGFIVVLCSFEFLFIVLLLGWLCSLSFVHALYLLVVKKLFF